MKRFALTAAIAAVSASLAFAALPAAADDAGNPEGADDSAGITALGVDIGQAGTSRADVHSFLSQLSPDARRAVIGGCHTYLNAQANAPAEVIPFCQTAVGG